VLYRLSISAQLSAQLSFAAHSASGVCAKSLLPLTGAPQQEFREALGAFVCAQQETKKCPNNRQNTANLGLFDLCLHSSAMPRFLSRAQGITPQRLDSEMLAPPNFSVALSRSSIGYVPEWVATASGSCFCTVSHAKSGGTHASSLLAAVYSKAIKAREVE
jgi:hypothetical protein